MKDYAATITALLERCDVQYNCCQGVMGTYAEEMGLTQDQVLSLGTFFGSGMGCGGTCGAVTGGLMTLGALGGSKQSSLRYLLEFQETFGALDCPSLLAKAKEDGKGQDYCKQLVYYTVDFLGDLS